MKLYLDDCRKAPEGWTLVKAYDECIAALKAGRVEELSLDHDLGSGCSVSGYDVLTWIEEQIVTNNYVPPEIIIIHSQNPAGVQKMKAALRSIMEKSPVKIRATVAPAKC
jgi:translation initiation factor 2 alpha subunit (eIF-2alpha)